MAKWCVLNGWMVIFLVTIQVYRLKIEIGIGIEKYA